MTDGPFTHISPTLLFLNSLVVPSLQITIFISAKALPIQFSLKKNLGVNEHAAVDSVNP